MRTMYDAVTATNIPTSPPPDLVAGYADQIVIPEWTNADWALFPESVQVHIVKKASSVFGNVLDVENGDATNAQVADWLTAMRAAGYTPSIYTSYSNWASVYDAVKSAGIAQPPYWIADYSQGNDSTAWWPVLYGEPAVAWQYTDYQDLYDISFVQDYWPGVDPDMEWTDSTGYTPSGWTVPLEYGTAIESVAQGLFWGGSSTPGGLSLFQMIQDLQSAIATLQASVATLQQPAPLGPTTFNVTGTLNATPEAPSGNA